MALEERNRKIKSYGSAHRKLVAALKRFPKEMWQFKPDPDRWTISEIIVHIADSEVHGYIRCHRLIAAPGAKVPEYDEVKRMGDLRQPDQDIDDALELFKSVRHKLYLLIKDLPESVWSNSDGAITMDNWLDIYERHIPEHIRQMQSNLEDWRSQTRAS